MLGLMKTRVYLVVALLGCFVFLEAGCAREPEFPEGIPSPVFDAKPEYVDLY